MKLSKDFYTDSDVVAVSRRLLGKKLCTNIDGVKTSGLITEVEAYCGRNDKACHANNGLRTARTEIMYAEGGVAYVYLCYGIHYLFNVVTNKKDWADAVLVRAIEPLEGLEHMLKRRNKLKLDKTLTAGPGALTKALGINKVHYGASLSGDAVWIEEGVQVSEAEIVASKRIGVGYAGEDANKLWRFYISNNGYISKL